MSKSYVIQWKSQVNGRAGRGTRLLEREEAERLAAELNQEYPDILHEPIPAASSPAPVNADSGSEQTESAANEPPTSTLHSFSSH